jgi:hypothetical protein
VPVSPDADETGGRSGASEAHAAASALTQHAAIKATRLKLPRIKHLFALTAKRRVRFQYRLQCSGRLIVLTSGQRAW